MNEQDLIKLKAQAKTLFNLGWKVTQIAEELKLKPNTIYSWKKRESWGNEEAINRVGTALETRLIALINREEKTADNAREIDFLTKQIEKMERVKALGRDGKSGKNSVKSEGKEKEKKSKRQPQNFLTEEQIFLLKSSFLKDMFDYQKKWYEAGLKYRIRNILKSRQIGATYYFAHEALVDALDTGRNQIFISASRKQALNFRSYIIDYVKQVTGVELKGDPIKLYHNDAQLIFLGTNSATAQGYHGNLYFDEIFWTQKFDIMRKVASAMASQKQYRQTYFSTPSTKAHPAYDFWSGKTYNQHREKVERVDIDLSHANLKDGKYCEDGQWRQIVNIFDAQERGCNLFDIEALRKDVSPSEFNQLFMCEFIEDEESIFPRVNLENCRVDALTEWRDFRIADPRPLGDSEVWIGYDPACTGDNSAIAIIAPPADKEKGIYRIIEVKTYQDADFVRQAEEIKRFCEKYRVTKISIDATGIGQGVYQEVQRFHPSTMPIQYSVNSKNEMVLKTQNLINKKRLQFDAMNTSIIGSFATIRKKLTRSGTSMTYYSLRTKDDSHGDVAWAIMNALINVPYGEVGGYRNKAVIGFY